MKLQKLVDRGAELAEIIAAVKRVIYIHPLALFCLCFGAGSFLFCAGLSLLRATNYQVEIAQYKLAVNSALHKAQEEINQIDRTVETAPLATKQKQKIKQSTQKSNAVIEEIQKDIKSENEQLSNHQE